MLIPRVKLVVVVMLSLGEVRVVEQRYQIPDLSYMLLEHQDSTTINLRSTGLNHHAWDFPGWRTMSDFILSRISPESNCDCCTCQTEDESVSAPIAGKRPPAAYRQGFVHFVD